MRRMGQLWTVQTVKVIVTYFKALLTQLYLGMRKPIKICDDALCRESNQVLL